MSPIEIRRTIADAGKLAQKRRDIDTYSSLGASSAAIMVGSSAMPHSGHAPGFSLSTSGCIGQVYFAPAGTIRGRAFAAWPPCAPCASLACAPCEQHADFFALGVYFAGSRTNM